MLCSLVLAVFLSSPPLAVIAVPSPVAQGQRAPVRSLMIALAEFVAEDGKKDEEAANMVDSLTREFPKCSDKEKELIVDAFGKCLDARRKTKKGELPDNTLYVPVAKGLGTMGEFATKELIKWIDHKKHRENLVLQRELIHSLGKTKDTGAIKTLTKLLNYKEDSVIAWAGEALANFRTAPEKTRKKIFEELLKVLTTAKTLRDSNGNDVLARKRYDTIGTPFMASLAALSGERLSSPEEWTAWWKKNRRVAWDKKKD